MPSYEVRARTTASPERVFAIVADGAGWSRWAGPVVVRSWWEREGTPAPGGIGAIRALGLKRIGSREEIVAYDPPHHLGYTLLSGMPVRGSFEPKLPGTAGALRLFFRTAVGGFLKRLAAEAERP
jgi:hypothetical protein